jgi:hypothetical protein
VTDFSELPTPKSMPLDLFFRQTQVKEKRKIGA